MPLEESVALDVSDAMSRVDDIGSALTSAAQSFAVALDEATQVLSSIRVEQVDASAVTSGIDEAVAASDTSPTITADASGVTTGIDDAVGAVGTPEVPIEPDTSGVASGIDEAVASVTPAPLEVPVDAGSITDGIDSALSDVDTSGLQGELDSAAGSASKLGSAGQEAGIGIGAIAPAAALATGEVGSLSDIIGEVTPGMAGAAAATVGVVAAGKDLFSSALEQNTALARLSQTYGDLADKIEHVNFGGINEDLSTLAVRTGANVDGLRNFAASFGTLGKSAGDSVPHVADVSQQIILLAERASVLNPNLGTADDIVQRLSTSLARGGRFLSAYGISLSTAQINAEALSETGKKTASDLSIYDKIVAGATLSTQQLGTALGTDINNGAQKAQVQLNALKAAFEETLKAAGAPLIQPVIDAFKALEPVLAALALLLGTTLADALHVVGPVLQILAPILQGIADAVRSIPQPITDAAVAFLIFNRVGPILADVVRAVASFAIATVRDFTTVGTAAEATAAETEAATTSMETSAAGAGGFGAALASINPVALGLAATIGLLVASIEAKNAADKNNADLSRQLGDALVKQKGDVAAAADEFLKARDGSGKFAEFLNQAGISMGTFTDAVGKGTPGVAALQAQLVHLHDQGKISNDTLSELTGTLQFVARDAENASHSTLASAVAQGELSRSTEVAAIKQHTARDGTVDWIGVLNDLRPQLAAAGTQVDQYGNQVAKVDPAQKALTDSTNSMASAQLNSLVASGRLTTAQAEQEIQLHKTADGGVDYLGILKDLDPKMATNAEKAGRLSDGLGDVRSGFDKAKDAADQFKTALDEALGIFISADEAAIKQAAAEDKLTQSLKDSAGSMDIKTEKGRAARQAFDDLLKADQDYIDAQVRESNGTITATQAKDNLIARLRDEEARYPGLKDQIDTYITKIQGIPPEQLTNTGLPNAGVSEADAENVAIAVKNIPPSWSTEYSVDIGDAFSKLQTLAAQIEFVDRLFANSPFATNFSGQPGEPGFPGSRAMAGGDFGAFQPVRVERAEVISFPVPFHVSPVGQDPNQATNIGPINVFESVTPEATARAVSNKVAAAIKL